MAVMRIAIILNGIALNKKYFLQKVLPAVNESFLTEVFETRSKHDAFHLASKVVDKRFDIIMAAGGDSTVHQVVVNGIIHGRETFHDLPIVGVFPIGTGNDFARTFKIIPHVDQLIFLLKTFSPRNIDISEVSFTAETGTGKKYFVNVADIGMGPEVGED